MHFIEGSFLWHLAWAVPLLAAMLCLSWSRRASILRRLFGRDPESHLNLSRSLRLLRFALLLGALALLGVAAARPSWGVEILPSGGSGRDLLVVFDVSKSMLCKDVQPSRLEHGKWFVRELVKRAHGDRFGLVAFAGTAFLECPLTSDKTSFLQALNELDVESIPVGGTNIQNALETALKAFTAAEGGHRAIILVTDGGELDGDSSKAIEKARELKTPFFVVGVGDPSQPQIIQAPDENGALRTIKDSNGETVKSPLNEKALGALALQSSGIYVRSTSANPGLEEIASRVAGLVPKDYDLGKQTRPIERFAYPLAAALLLFLVWLCVSERGFRRAAAALALLCALSLSAEDAQKPEQTAAAAPEVKASASPLEIFNKAVDLQNAGKDAKTAGKLYEDAINKAPADKELVSRSCQNLGVIAHDQARSELKKTVDEDLKGQNLDGAEKRVGSALKALEGAEELYREGLRSPGEAGQGLKADQQMLLLDRDSAEKLKKRIEEIKKQIEQAKKDLKQAQQQQKQQNQGQQNQQQGQQSQQNQQQQGQQQNQQQQGQQQNQQQGSQQSSAQQSAQNAKESVDKLKDIASSMEQRRLENSAERSSKEIEQAQKAQEKGDGKSAEKHLDEAMKQLAQAGEDKNGEEKKDGQQDSKGKGDGKKDEDRKQSDGSDGNKQDRKLDKSQDSGKPKDASEAKEEKEIDPAQAESVLESMANDEKGLRDAIKRNQRESYGNPHVEKDW